MRAMSSGRDDWCQCWGAYAVPGGLAKSDKCRFAYHLSSTAFNLSWAFP
jgi:hypothetical protein